MRSTVPNAIPGFRFRIEAFGVEIGQASTISGLSTTTEIITYRGGADSHAPRKQKGLTSYSDVVIERIYTNNSGIWTMLGLVFQPTFGALGLTSPIYKTQLIITFMDLDGNERAKFFLKDAWVSSYEISQIDANASEYAIERVTFSHEGFSKLGIDL